MRSTLALAVIVDSPGGSPAQSEIMCDKILNFKRLNNLKLYTFAESKAASGGYFILCIGIYYILFLLCNLESC